jgi:G3E family GTPase
MTKVDVFSGFLGAGKTTLIKKLIAEAYQGESLVLIENEFGEIGIDGGFMQEAGIRVNEMNSGCICCSLVGDFAAALERVLAEYAPDRILIEPSGVGKLSDVIRAVAGVDNKSLELNSFTTIVDATKCKLYIKNFGEFFNDQIEHANCLVLSRTAKLPEEKLLQCVELLRAHNKAASLVTAPWEQLRGDQLLAAMEQSNTLAAELKYLEEELHHEHEHHEHHDHHHDHPHDHHHQGHDADDIFQSWGVESAKAFSRDQLESILSGLGDGACGDILRAKGIVANAEGGEWLQFDSVPGEVAVRLGAALPTGRVCVIGAKLDEAAIRARFGL